MKSLFSVAFLISAVTLTAVSKTELWTKSFSSNSSILRDNKGVRVGADGAVVITTYKISSSADNYFWWYKRSGELIAEGDLTIGAYPITQYVSEDALLISSNDGKHQTQLWQVVENDQVVTEVVESSTDTYGSPNTNISFNFPYFLELKSIDGDAVATLYDLIDPNILEVVGDADIGIHGKNLKVRWKTVVGAKYKVQQSVDMETWTDYTQLLDGTGSSLIINIPISSSTDKLFARVIKI